MSNHQIVELGELCDVSGGDAAPQGGEYFTNDGIPFVRMKDLGRYHFTDNLTKTDDRLTLEAVKAHKMRIFEPGCILFPRSGSVFLNHRAILGVRACIVSHIGVLQNFDSRINARYLYRVLQSFDMSRFAKKTTGVDSISFSDVKRIPIPVPPLAEQERIARILEEADELRRLRGRADERAADLIPAIFDEMFVKNGHYPSRKLSEVCEFITKGTTPPASEIKDVRGEGDVPYLKVYHITDKGDINFESNPSFVSESLHQGLLNRSKVYPRDVLMNIVGPPLGKIGLVPNTYPEWNINQALAIFRATDQIEPIFLLYALRSSQILPGILKQAVGIRQLNLSLQQCRDTVIPVPPLLLQRQFVARVAEVRALEESQEASWKMLDDLFQSLLHRAFTGEL